jgi:regulatory protein YycH of two-component signal transduction system YycFG
MSSVNLPNYNIDQTVRIFDEFYVFDQVVPVAEYDAVYSYMRSQFDGDEAAGNFTVTLFRVAQESGVGVLNLLQEIQRYDQPELTAVLAYYLNGLRSSSTLYGVQSVILPNYYAARNVLP